MAQLVELYNTDHAQLINWISKEYALGSQREEQPYQLHPRYTVATNPHRMRRDDMAARLQLYRDNIYVPLAQLIDQIYTTDEMRRTLKQYIQISAGLNVSRRIVNEVASLYDRPALRILKKRNDEFHVEEKRIGLHFIMQEGTRLTNLCNEVLIWQFKGIDNKTRLRIVTPDCFDAVPDPRDTLQPAAFIIDRKPVSMLTDVSNLPHWELWDDTYRYLISKMGRMVDENGKPVDAPEEHKLGRIPGVLFHRREPTTDILDGSYGEDIRSTHMAVALLDVMAMKLAKSQGENQPILQGNLAQMVTGQSMNGEKPLLLPPEVTASMLQMKTDPQHYINLKRDRIGSLAQTYGMSYEQLTFQETAQTSSGKAYQVRREKLTELRLEQRMRAVDHEAQVVDLMGFDPEGMRVDHQEQALPQDAVEEVGLLADKMKMGLDSPKAFLMRKDPDLDEEGATVLMMKNLADYAQLIVWVRALNTPYGADASNTGDNPVDNGAKTNESDGTVNFKSADMAVDALFPSAVVARAQGKQQPPPQQQPNTGTQPRVGPPA